MCPPFEWSEWSPCSKACGRGHRYRKAIYQFVCPTHSEKCPDHRLEEEICDLPCHFDPEKYGGPGISLLRIRNSSHSLSLFLSLFLSVTHSHSQMVFHFIQLILSILPYILKTESTCVVTGYQNIPLCMKVGLQYKLHPLLYGIKFCSI